MPSLRSCGCGPTSNSYPALSRLFVEQIDPCCNDCKLTIGDNNIVVDTQYNRIGINTEFPTEALDVNGNIYTNGAFSADSADIGNGTIPGATALTVTGNSDFLGDLNTTGNITSAGTFTTTGNITTSTGGFYVSTTKVPVDYSLSATPTDAATAAAIDIVNTNANSITILFNNLKQKLSTAGGLFYIEVGYTSSGTNTYLSSTPGPYSGVTWGVSSGVTHNNYIQLTSSNISNSEYWNGIITFSRTVSSGGQKFYQYIGTVNNSTNNFTINGRLSYTSSLPNINLFRITMSNQFDGVAARYIQAQFTA